MGVQFKGSGPKVDCSRAESVRFLTPSSIHCDPLAQALSAVLKAMRLGPSRAKLMSSWFQVKFWVSEFIDVIGKHQTLRPQAVT